MISRSILYAAIAMLPVIAQTETMPPDVWAWVKFGASVLLAGCTAIKALQSTPPAV